MLILDTHVVLHSLTGDLTARERRQVGSHAWSIAAITLWEIAKLAELGRIEVDLEDPELRRVLSGLHVWPITFDICRKTLELDFEGDPADELIAATSIVQKIPLLTRDRKMRDSKLVPIA
jgi:PIN domain nuclease of toxin-antitoxin system